MRADDRRPDVQCGFPSAKREEPARPSSRRGQGIEISDRIKYRVAQSKSKRSKTFTVFDLNIWSRGQDLNLRPPG